MVCRSKAGMGGCLQWEGAGGTACWREERASGMHCLHLQAKESAHTWAGDRLQVHQENGGAWKGLQPMSTGLNGSVWGRPDCPELAASGSMLHDKQG